MTDENTPLRVLLNRSGVPFQLAVEKEIARVGSNHRIDLIKREVPWAEGLIDTVARHREKNFFLRLNPSELMTKLGSSWCPRKNRVTRARLEFFNGESLRIRPESGL